MDDCMRLSHIARDNNKCFYFSMKATHAMRIIYSKWNSSTDYSRALLGALMIQKPWQFGKLWNKQACELNVRYWLRLLSLRFHKKNEVFNFFFTQSKQWLTLQKIKLGRLTLLREVLDNEKTPAPILTVSLFMPEKKRQSVNMPSCFMKALWQSVCFWQPILTAMQETIPFN